MTSEIFEKLKCLVLSDSDIVHSSNVEKALDNEHYNAILDYGEEAIPFILKEYETDPHKMWGLALHLVTGENPVQDTSRGIPQAIRNDWMEWARQKGLIK